MDSTATEHHRSNGNGKIKYLDKIHGPNDLKKYSLEELKEVAHEVRDTLITTCAQNGGHIGANLGVVELTIALHYVFRSPQDKILLDTSHQSYVHKLLTGRYESFHTICTPGGIPRFTDLREGNAHDCWAAGHASTALSGAMGFAEARDQQKQNFEVICVVGDGALSGGMCYEALNNIGYNQTNLLIVLNDNKMSISHNVGAMYEYLKRLSNVALEERNRREVGTIFERLGIKYYGPIDGHDLNQLTKTLQEMQHIPGPKLLHVLTQKGKGMDYMETDKTKWHEHGAFDADTGEPAKAKMPSIEGRAVDALIELAEKDEKIVAITAAMATGTGLVKFGEKFPKRFYDVGIAEEHAATFAAGLALDGIKPFFTVYSPFLQRAFDQMYHDVAMQDAAVRFLIPKATLLGDGPTQGGIMDLSYLRIIPKMVVAAPMNESEMRDMVLTAAEHNTGPIAVRYPKGETKLTEIKPMKALEIGKGEILREGKDITLIGIGWLTQEAVRAAELLQSQGIEATVINARFVKPLDERLLLNSLKKTGRGITVEENTLPGGFGSAVLEMMEEHNVSDIPIKRVGGKDDFVGYDSAENIKKAWGMKAENIVEKAKQLVGK